MNKTNSQVIITNQELELIVHFLEELKTIYAGESFPIPVGLSKLLDSLNPILDKNLEWEEE